MYPGNIGFFLHPFCLVHQWVENSVNYRLNLHIVVLFGGFRHTQEFFHLYGNITIIGEGLQILTYTQHSWPLSSEGYLACHIYCDMGHSFTMVISMDP